MQQKFQEVRFLHSLPPKSKDCVRQNWQKSPFWSDHIFRATSVALANLNIPALFQILINIYRVSAIHQPSHKPSLVTLLPMQGNENVTSIIKPRLSKAQSGKSLSNFIKIGSQLELNLCKQMLQYIHNIPQMTLMNTPQECQTKPYDTLLGTLYRYLDCF